MTEIDKPVTRKSYSSYRGRRLVITLHPTWLSEDASTGRVSFEQPRKMFEGHADFKPEAQR